MKETKFYGVIIPLVIIDCHSCYFIIIHFEHIYSCRHYRQSILHSFILSYILNALFTERKEITCKEITFYTLKV